MKRTALLLLPLLVACRSPVEAPAEAEPRAMFQRIADQLPRASWGWGEPPGVVTYSASEKAQGPAPEPEQPKATERGFSLVLEVLRPRTVTIPYSAIDAVYVGWRPMPNAILAPLLIVPFQRVGVTVVIDGAKVPSLLDSIERDCVRLEQISREVGMGGPWSHAQDVREKLRDDAAEHGPGRIELRFDRGSAVPAWFPRHGACEEDAQAFAWAAKHPDVVLPEKKEEAPSKDAPPPKSP